MSNFVIFYGNLLHHTSYFFNFRLCPIFQVSNVSGENLELLKMFLNLLTTRMTGLDDLPAEFQIDDTYSVPGMKLKSMKNVIRFLKFHF